MNIIPSDENKRTGTPMKGKQTLKQNGNIVLNFRGSAKSEFGLYAEAYHESAQILARKLSLKAGYSDLDACPIVFLYRHALELYLKGIIIAGNNLFGPAKKDVFYEEDKIWSHGLSRLLPITDKIFKKVGWKWEKGLGGFKDFNQLRLFVSQIESIDPYSYSFRYPIKKNGNASVPKNYHFNVLEFSRQMDELLDLLSGAILGLEAMFDEMTRYL